MNSISVQTSMTTNVDGFNGSLRSSISQNTTSSNTIAQSVTVTGSAWTQLSLGVLTDVRNAMVYNDPAVYSGSVIALATGSNGGNIIAILQPGDGASVPWSGSFNSLYAKVLTPAPNINGVVQYLAQSA